MAEAYPSQVSTFKVTGRLGRGVGDEGDTGQAPDLIPIAGAKILFTPMLQGEPVFTVLSAAPPITIFQETVEATTDEQGYLKMANDPNRDVFLAWGGDPDINPSGWSWMVSIEVGGNFRAREFVITGTAGGTVDLASASQLPTNPGQNLTEWQAAVLATDSNRIAAASSASQARTAANEAKAVDLSADTYFLQKINSGAINTRLVELMQQTIEESVPAVPRIESGSSNVHITNVNDVLEISVDPAVEQDPYMNQTPIIVVYGTNLSTARPTSGRKCMWLGTGNPSNALAGDVILSTSVISGGGTSPGSFVGVLDGRATPFRAHSLRRLSGLYTGPAIRVQRSSDGTEQNIGFKSDGTLDTAALLAFAGSGGANVVTFYDQSGNGRHFTAASVSVAPAIVVAGALVANASKPAMQFNGTSHVLISDVKGLYDAGAMTFAAVLAADAASADTVFGEVGTNTSNSYRVRIGAGASSPILRFAATASTTSLYSLSAAADDVTFNGSMHHLFLVDSGSLVNYWRDKLQKLTNGAAPRSGSMFLERTSLGAAGYSSSGTSGYVSGLVQEVIAWGQDLTADRDAISNDQFTFWGLV